MSIHVDGKDYTLPDQINTIAALPPGQYQLAIRRVKASTDVKERAFASLIEQQRKLLESKGGLGVAAPNQRNAGWPNLKDVVAPFDNASGGNDSKTFGFWFNYFWSEARDAYDLTAAGQTQLCDAFFAVLESNGTGGYKPNTRLAQLDNTQKQNILLNVMRVGFKRIQVIPGEGANMAPRALDTRTMFAMKVSGQKDKVVRTLPLGFRGDNRPFDELVKSGGFLARARSRGAAIHTAYGLDQAWHPFNQPIYAESLFVRKGKSMDNCLHTVISVASSLEEMMPYPLLSDGSLFKIAPKNPATWDANDVLYTTTHWLGLKIVRDPEPHGPIDRLTTEKNIYVLDMSESKGFHTEDWQRSLGVNNPFPERAVDEVPPERILGLLRVRKHYFFRTAPTGGGVLTFFDIDNVDFKFLMDENVIRQWHGDTAPLDIRGVIERGIKNARFNMAGDRDAYVRGKQVAQNLSGAPKTFPCRKGCGLTFPTMKDAANHLSQCTA